jgi:hypothetical protein
LVVIVLYDLLDDLFNIVRVAHLPYSHWSGFKVLLNPALIVVKEESRTPFLVRKYLEYLILSINIDP